MYSHYLQNKLAYTWIVNHWVKDEETITQQTFRALLDYMDRRGKSPASIEALIQYIMHNPDNDKRYEKTNKLEEELRELKKYDPAPEWDTDVLFADLLNAARKEWMLSRLKLAHMITIGSWSPDKKAETTGVGAAEEWLRAELTKDFRPEAPVIAGLLQDNTAAIRNDIDAKMVSLETSGKYPLGFWHIDNLLTIGRQNLRFLGIVGMSGDGKTTITNAIVYNWLCAGAHILYVSTEHSPTEIWESMAWLHQDHPDYGFRLPALQQWEDGLNKGTATMDDRRNLLQVLKDIQTRRNIPGLLDVQQYFNWDAIKDYLTVNHKTHKYDILVIDYLGRMEVPGDQKYRDKAVGAIITNAQKLSREWDDNRGLVILTPIQVNREGNKRAKGAEEGEARYDLNAIGQFSEYQHHLDLALSVYSDEEMKCNNQCEIQVIKKRKGMQPLPMTMTIDPNSGAFLYGDCQREVEAKKPYNRTAEEMGVTTEDLSSWGL
jgi:RecA/RadA recombinase